MTVLPMRRGGTFGRDPPKRSMWAGGRGEIAAVAATVAVAVAVNTTITIVEVREGENEDRDGAGEAGGVEGQTKSPLAMIMIT